MNIVCPTITVIIPTYNRATTLKQTLESIGRQSYPVERYEVVVVDNNSTDNTKEIVDQWAATSTVPTTYVLERRQGVHHARNTAAKRSSADILYYTDDDMVADRDLLRNLVVGFQLDPRVVCVGGSVLPLWQEQPPRWVHKLCRNAILSLTDRTEFLVVAPDDPGIYSCHEAIRREAFLATTGFNPENTKGVWIGDGETGLNRQLRSRGGRFAYVANSITHHIIPASRMTQSYLNARLANQGNADAYTAYRDRRYSNARLMINVLFHAARMLAAIWFSLVQALCQRDGWHITAASVSYRQARMLYDVRLIWDGNWRSLVLRDDWLAEPDEMQ